MQDDWHQQTKQQVHITSFSDLTMGMYNNKSTNTTKDSWAGGGM